MGSQQETGCCVQLGCASVPAGPLVKKLPLPPQTSPAAAAHDLLSTVRTRLLAPRLPPALRVGCGWRRWHTPCAHGNVLPRGAAARASAGACHARAEPVCRTPAPRAASRVPRRRGRGARLCDASCGAQRHTRRPFGARTSRGTAWLSAGFCRRRVTALCLQHAGV